MKRRMAIEDILGYLDTRAENCQGMSLVGKENESRSRCLMSSLCPKVNGLLETNRLAAIG